MENGHVHGTHAASVGVASAKPLTANGSAPPADAPTLLEVVDLKSTNGTFVNGRRVQHARVSDGDCLRIGRVELRVSKGG